MEVETKTLPFLVGHAIIVLFVGRTMFPDINKIVRLKFGEFLLHPGSLVHAGVDITHGNRYLYVLFAHLKK